jgi:hypothetical protein
MTMDREKCKRSCAIEITKQSVRSLILRATNSLISWFVYVPCALSKVAFAAPILDRAVPISAPSQSTIGL